MICHHNREVFQFIQGFHLLALIIFHSWYKLHDLISAFLKEVVPCLLHVFYWKECLKNFMTKKPLMAWWFSRLVSDNYWWTSTRMRLGSIMYLVFGETISIFHLIWYTFEICKLVFRIGWSWIVFLVNFW